jgi:uncharacterized membrane protein YoaK (UPF0700 family)
MLAAVAACLCMLSRKGGGSTEKAFAPPAGIAKLSADYAIAVGAGIIALCCVIAKTEVAQKPPAAVPVEKRSDYTTFMLMSAFLSWLSGMVNAMAILEMGMTVAHHTGNASHTGRLLGETATRFFRLMVAYAFGAGVAGYVKVDGEAVYQGRYSPSLLAAAIAVFGGCMIRWFTLSDVPELLDYKDGRAAVTLVLWAFSQGIQNAISRKCSSMPVCTTHMTGYLTDFGSNLGGILQATINGEAGPPPQKPAFFGLSIFAFGAGGLCSKIMKPYFGAQACLLPAVLMAATAVGAVPITSKVAWK